MTKSAAQAELSSPMQSRTAAFRCIASHALPCGADEGDFSQQRRGSLARREPFAMVHVCGGQPG
jgi:hypothetical protein